MIDLDAPLPEWGKLIALAVTCLVYGFGLGWLAGMMSNNRRDQE